MEQQKSATERAQTNHEATNEIRMKWASPHLSPIDVAADTATGKAFAGVETVSNAAFTGRLS